MKDGAAGIIMPITYIRKNRSTLFNQIMDVQQFYRQKETQMGSKYTYTT